MGNQTVYGRGSEPFYEVYYLTVNHHETRSAFWLRATLLNTHTPNPDRRGGLWLARFAEPEQGGNLALRVPIDESRVAVRDGGFELRLADSVLREGHWEAQFTADGHDVRWSLDWTPNETAVWLIPPLVRRLGVNKADVAVQNVDIAVHGLLTIDGETYTFQGAPAGQSHHWGIHYAREWIWAHCNDFVERPGAWLEALSVKMVHAGPVKIPVTMFALHTGESSVRINATSQMFTSRAAYQEGRWVWTVQDGYTRADVELSAPPSRFVAFPYESPHNQMYTCHNTCQADILVRVFTRRFGGWRLVDELRGPERAAAEFCTREDTDPMRYRFAGMRAPRLVNVR